MSNSQDFQEVYQEVYRIERSVNMVHPGYHVELRPEAHDEMLDSGMLVVAQRRGTRLVPRPDWYGPDDALVGGLSRLPVGYVDLTEYGQIKAPITTWHHLIEAMVWASRMFLMTKKGQALTDKARLLNRTLQDDKIYTVYAEGRPGGGLENQGEMIQNRHGLHPTMETAGFLGGLLGVESRVFGDVYASKQIWEQVLFPSLIWMARIRFFVLGQPIPNTPPRPNGQPVVLRKRR